MALTPRVFDLLLALVKSDGRVLTKDELLATIWKDCIVEESNLSQSIFVLRKALGESIYDPHLIRTIPTKGYRFIGDVKVTDSIDPSLQDTDQNRLMSEVPTDKETSSVFQSFDFPFCRHNPYWAPLLS